MAVGTWTGESRVGCKKGNVIHLTVSRVLQCIKKNGSSLEHLELSRSSLLRMDPLRFRNVLSATGRLQTLVVKNICSDAMLKLIGAHCNSLQFLVVANSKQVGEFSELDVIT